MKGGRFNRWFIFYFDSTINFCLFKRTWLFDFFSCEENDFNDFVKSSELTWNKDVANSVNNSRVIH